MWGGGGLKAIDTNPTNYRVKILRGKCQHVLICPIFFLTPSVSYQHGLGVLHLLYGRVGHHAQLVHQDRHRVPAQTQDLRAEHPGGARQGGFRVFPRALRALHLQIRGGVFEPVAEKRQENSHTCGLAGPEWHRSVFRGGTVLSGTAREMVAFSLGVAARRMEASSSLSPLCVHHGMKASLDHQLHLIHFCTALWTRSSTSVKSCWEPEVRTWSDLKDKGVVSVCVTYHNVNVTVYRNHYREGLSYANSLIKHGSVDQ